MVRYLPPKLTLTKDGLKAETIIILLNINTFLKYSTYFRHLYYSQEYILILLHVIPFCKPPSGTLICYFKMFPQVLSQPSLKLDKYTYPKLILQYNCKRLRMSYSKYIFFTKYYSNLPSDPLPNSARKTNKRAKIFQKIIKIPYDNFTA